MNAYAVPEFLQDDAISLLLFGGKGGVGKTTCASASALYLALQHPTRSFLLVSTDPAHSLMDCFAGTSLPPNLTLREINPQDSLARFKAQHESHLRTIATRGTFLDHADIDQLVDLSMPGLDETMALLEIVSWVKGGQYSCIVVDTAPAGHTLKLLELPTLLRQWLDALDTMLAKYRYMSRLYRGTYLKDAVDLYLEEAIDDLSSLWALLRSSKKCRFVPVMLAESLSIHVTRTMLNELQRMGLPIREIVANRLLLTQTHCPECLDWIERQATALDEINSVFSVHPLWCVPLFLEEMTGRESLLQIWTKSQPLSPNLLQINHTALKSYSRLVPICPDVVTNPSPLPAIPIKLLMFAGKGGVGKTTLACASALRLAHSHQGKEILLFSIDPAHSIGACLGVTIGPHETRVAPGLTAIELDAKAEYTRLKNDYASELTGVFKRASGPSGVDLAFDREVMERMLDVAPLGLDEILALTRIVELMDRGRYDLFVLDTAPTGHLLRFLEMPQLIDQWLKTFFGLFLKYKKIFWLPKITETMVELSKRIKVFRHLLVDPRQAALFAVTIPTEMAFSETQDLLAACDRLRIASPVVFINLLTPSSNCPVCTRLNQFQLNVVKKYKAANPSRHLTMVDRQIEPRGLGKLCDLGNALYAM